MKAVAIGTTICNRPGWVDQDMVSVLQGGKGLAGVKGRLARRVGRRPMVSGVDLVERYLTLKTMFLDSAWAASRRALLTALNSERGAATALTVGDTVPPEGLVLALGPWDAYVDDDGDWHVREVLERETAAVSGAVHFEAGRESRQRGMVIEEATTNLIVNPSVELNTTGWATNWSDTLARSDDVAKFGTYSLKITNDALDHMGAYHSDVSGLTPSDTVMASAWVYIPKNNGVATISLYVSDGGGFTNAVASDACTEVETWTRLTVQKTVPGGGSVRAYVYAGSQEAGKIVYVDGVQLEDRGYVTSYCDGSLGPGYAWSSTVHGSTSTRTATGVNLDSAVDLISQTEQLSFRAVVRVPYDADGTWPDADSYDYLMTAEGDGSNRIWLSYRNDEDKWMVHVGWDQLNSSVQTFEAGDWVEIVVTVDCDADDMRLYVNGEADGVYSGSLTAPPLTDWVLGSNVDEDDRWGNFTFAEFDVWDRVLTAGEIAGMYVAGTAMGRARAVDVICEDAQSMVLGGFVTDRGVVATLLVDGDVRWRSCDGDVAFWRVYDDTGQYSVDVDSDDEVRPVLRVTPQTAKDAGSGYQYRRFVVVEWKAERSATQYPTMIGTLDTATLVTATKMQSDGDDLRVFVDGVEVDRWLADMDDAYTKVWVNLDWAPAEVADLRTAIADSGEISEIVVQADEDISQFPESGLLLIDAEVFFYTGKNNTDRKFTGVTRAARGTSMAAHTEDDDVKWVQHDVYLVYGDSTVDAPEVDDDYEPAFELDDSTNDSWVYEEFGEDDELRTGGWVTETVEEAENGTVTFSTANQTTTADPWVDIGVELLVNDLYTGYWAARWKVYNPCGIDEVAFTNGEERIVSDDWTSSDSAVQSSEDGHTWEDEYAIGEHSSWTAWSYSAAITAGSLWAAVYADFVHTKSLDGDSNRRRAVELADATLTLDTTYTPDVTIGDEESNYTLNATIENETTGDALTLYFPVMTLDETLVVDTCEETVRYLKDGSSQLQVLGLVGGARVDWLRLVRGENVLTWSDTGTAEVEVEVRWERRDWE